jgi:hypothetical protein
MITGRAGRNQTLFYAMELTYILALTADEATVTFCVTFCLLKYLCEAVNFGLGVRNRLFPWFII